MPHAYAVVVFLVAYCNEECQRAAFATHKEWCGKLRSILMEELAKKPNTSHHQSDSGAKRESLWDSVHFAHSSTPSIYAHVGSGKRQKNEEEEGQPPIKKGKQLGGNKRLFTQFTSNKDALLAFIMASNQRTGKDSTAGSLNQDILRIICDFGFEGRPVFGTIIKKRHTFVPLDAF
jgi:hypothetical protein